MADLRAALDRARSLGDPALFVRVAPRLLAIAGNAPLADEARAVAAGVAQSLP